MPDAAPLHMLQIRLSSRELARAARRQGIPATVDDLGYQVHGILAALFGDLAPKPFQATAAGRGSQVLVLGYGAAGAQALEEHADAFALPEDLRCLQSLDSKVMPATWAEGRRLGFEVLACPVVRTSSATEHRKAGAEVDAFLAACDRHEGEEDLRRVAVYREWLAAQLDPAARLVTADLQQFQRVKLYRRTQGSDRRGKALERPQALFQGELEVADGAAFARLLARGVGRHRAFGYGMLLLRPPGRKPGGP